MSSFRRTSTTHSNLLISQLLTLIHFHLSQLLDLGGDDDDDDPTTATLPQIPVSELSPAPLDPPVNLSPPPSPQLPLLSPVPPPAPVPLCHTQCVSCSSGEWWTVKHAVQLEAEPPVIWSDDEEDAADDQHANSVSGSEPRTYKQALLL